MRAPRGATAPAAEPLLRRGPDRDGEEHLGRLRLVALVVPPAFLLSILLWRGAIVDAWPNGNGHTVLDGVLLVATLAFSVAMFRAIDTRYRALLATNRDLAAVDTVVDAARHAYTPDAVARASLSAILHVTGATTARIDAPRPDADTDDTWTAGRDTPTGPDRRNGPTGPDATDPAPTAPAPAAPRTVDLLSGPDPVGVLTLHGTPGDDDPLGPDAYTGIGRAVGAALQRARYLTLLQQEIHDAATAERERIAREMHDSLAQVLGATHLRLRALENHPDVTRSADVTRELADIADTCHEAYADVREAILGLRGPGRRDTGLLPSLEAYVRTYTRRSGIDTTLAAGGPVHLHPHQEIQVIRVVQEALTNVRKHSGARTAHVTLSPTGGRLLVVVDDDGDGFDPTATPDGHYGLETMRERAALLDGTLDVRSTPGRGTSVALTVPLHHPAALDEQVSA